MNGPRSSQFEDALPDSDIGWLGRLRRRGERIAFANLADDIKWKAEQQGYHVHVNTNERRIVVTPRQA